MTSKVIAKRYAKALVNLALKKNQLETFGTQLSDIVNTVQSNQELTFFLENPKISKIQKRTIIEKILIQESFETFIKNFVFLLNEKNRMFLLQEIKEVYEELQNQHLNKVIAHVTVPRPLNEIQEQQLIEQLSTYTGKHVSLKISVNPDILGGVVTSINSLLLDGSIKNQLNQFYKTMIQG